MREGRWSLVLPGTRFVSDRRSLESKAADRSRRCRSGIRERGSGWGWFRLRTSAPVRSSLFPSRMAPYA